MANSKGFTVLFFMFVVCLSSFSLWSVVANEDKKDYIVYMGSTSKEYSLTSEHHLAILQEVIKSSNAEEVLLRSYGRSFNGFAAKLTEEESENLKRLKGVVSVFPSRELHIQTTRSWDFIGLPETIDRDVSAESDIIIGVIDTGIWPESPSFRDDGFGPPPKKWKGVCNGGQNFTCNNKLIGARGYKGTARDSLGHGSHTASTAAGRKVPGTSFYGIAEGSARGGVPSARIAAYKVCHPFHCDTTAIMAAFDDAIADGVDLITISIGGDPTEFDKDVIAIGAFHALAKGILTVQSAGNGGDLGMPVGSVAPWIFTVAASSMDRHIIDKVVLGDGKTLVGNSINSFSLKGDNFPLVHAKFASIIGCNESTARTCACLNSSLVEGKIVVCDQNYGIVPACAAGATGAVALNPTEDVSFIVPMPAVELGTHEFDALLSYLNSTKAPVANILKSEAIKDSEAPVVASFSSRGPNKVASDVLKPDISAPGIEVLAAFSPVGPLTAIYTDKRSVNYTVLSGTSMACPHVAGAAAYLKSMHPDWSPTAIKSALMTTARPMSSSKNPEGEFAYGSGHLNPMGATNPGLVYEATTGDYVSFLCNVGYDEDKIRLITGDKTSSCPKKTVNGVFPKDVNYPSMSVRVDDGKPFNVKFQRTVTNIGVANSTYVAKVESGTTISIKVEPSSLAFKSLKEKQSFSVTVVGKGLVNMQPVSASLVWSDGIHSVRSPIVVYSH